MDRILRTFHTESTKELKGAGHPGSPKPRATQMRVFLPIGNTTMDCARTWFGMSCPLRTLRALRVRLGGKAKTPGYSNEYPGVFEEEAGNDVLSHRVSSAVPSALPGLTTGVGMGTGVTLAE